MSVSRTLLRQLWMIDFLSRFLKNLIKDQKETLQSCLRESYIGTFEERHNYVVKQAVKLAIMASPYRENFEKNTGLGPEEMGQMVE